MISGTASSSACEEAVSLRVEDAKVLAPGGYFILEPMSLVELLRPILRPLTLGFEAFSHAFECVSRHFRMLSSLRLRYSNSWHAASMGPKVPLRSLTLRLPMANLCVSLAAAGSEK